MCHDITSDKFDEELNNFCISDSLPKYKSKMEVGNTVIMNTKHFNWLQKIIWRILLGIKIEDLEEK
jgi:hypothetical protein